MDLTKNFSFEEMVQSQTAARLGISNAPPAALIPRLTLVAEALETVRTLLGVPVIVSSGYRCAKLNSACGGVPTSAHCLGWAADFIAPQFGSPLEVCKKIEASDLKFDQLIYEYGQWTHLSIDPRMRRQVLQISSSVRGYQPGLPA